MNHKVGYAQLHSFTHYSFLKSASYPHEIVKTASTLAYKAIAITDECSLAGIVKAHVAAKLYAIKLLVGSYFILTNNVRIVAIAPNKLAYQELSGFITLARMRMPKGKYEAHISDLRFRLKNCLIIVCMDENNAPSRHDLIALKKSFNNRIWLGASFDKKGSTQKIYNDIKVFGREIKIPITVCKKVFMHCASKKTLLDVIYAINENSSVYEMHAKLEQNECSHLYKIKQLEECYPSAWLAQTQVISDLCDFNLSELRYDYPHEIIPKESTPAEYLRFLTLTGASKRWPEGVPENITTIIEKELNVISEMCYEHFFITVYDLVCFARQEGIFYQGRGSAANSVVCFCLFITEISPDKINVLFERFISKERDEPPDIDVDFENARREEVIQYIYKKYGRERAALAATVITYRVRSAIRDVGKALGINESIITVFAKTIVRWDTEEELKKRVEEFGFVLDDKDVVLLFDLVTQIIGFPRHLSQHVGGFVIAQDKVSDLVPQENAAMTERTVIQWDKEDLESLGLLKVDVLALGMLTALRKMTYLVKKYTPDFKALEDIPADDSATYNLICNADTIGVFQIESRAQMTMLPRLKPRTFYDLVIEIALVRPGPIMGDMVHPYLRRRNKRERVTYESEELKQILKPTLGVPIFQEQVIRIAMVAAGFSGGEADQLRRAMTSWGKNSRLLEFEEKFVNGMLSRGYRLEFAQNIFEQVKGFGGYGFPESHSASFAILCYFSCWFKTHHPEAFYCGLLNSQPMGFYSPSQLIQDALRHNVIILPVDVRKSFWDNMLVKIKDKKGIRLGFRHINHFSERHAQQIIEARKNAPFENITDLARRAKLSTSVIGILASADTLKMLAGNRFEARWQVSAIKPKLPLFSDSVIETSTDFMSLPKPSDAQETLNDYLTLGHTLKRHPLDLLRKYMPFKQCIRAESLLEMTTGKFVKIAGLVTCRQRPGTAKGVLFLTLEDETGNANVVVWQSLQERSRHAILNATLLIVKGHVEVSEGVAHVIAGAVDDVSNVLEELPVKNRRFF